MRFLMLAFAALTLGACDQVYSRTPLISEAREQGDPELRPGLWQLAGYQDPACQFDIRQPTFRWPECAAGAEYQRGQWWLVSRQNRLLAQTVRLTEADPAQPGLQVLAQSHFSADVFADPRIRPPQTADNPMFGWTYAALTVVKTDAAARIVEAKVIQPRCGPVQPAQLKDGAFTAKAGAYKTYPGLTLVGTACAAKDLDTIKAALKLSGDSEPRTIRWLRDRP